MSITTEQLAAALRARADWLDLPRDVEVPRPYITREQFRAAAAMLDAQTALVAEVERLRAVLTELVAAHDVKGEAQHAGTQKAIVRACAREDRAWERARAALPEEPK